MLFNERIPLLDEIGIPIVRPIQEGPPDIIAGLLPSRGELLIAGETNIGKSLLALEICSSFITGQPLWGELKPTRTANKILYILGEHYIEIIQRLWQHTKLPLTEKVIILGPEQLKFDKYLVNNGKRNPFVEEKFSKWVEGCDLVVFDPLAAFIAGGDGAENDNIHMRVLIETINSIVQSAGATALVLAHQGKPMMDKFGSEHSRKSYAIRGASGIEDAATNIFYFGKAEGSSGASEAAKDHKVLTLRCRKYKGLAPEEYRLMRNPHTLCHTLLGNRPFSEVRKLDTQAKIGRLQIAMPEAKMSEIIKIIAASEGISDSTVRRYLE